MKNSRLLVATVGVVTMLVFGAVPAHTHADAGPDKQLDCNDNGVGDQTEIDADPGRDINGNGVLDECELYGDLDGSGVVGVGDLVLLIVNWGMCPHESICPGDLNADFAVDVQDMLVLFFRWGLIE
jgi:hypothetical protein